VTHKDSKQLDSRFPRHEVKKGDEISQSSGQQRGGSEQLSPELPRNLIDPQASEETQTVTKVEAGDRVVTSPTREDSLTTGAENSADFPFFHVYGWG
jgi:hypothetical protein